MKDLFKYIIVVFVLCFGIKTQAQTAIEHYQDKKSVLSSQEFQKLDYLVNGGDSYMLVDSDNKTIVYNKLERVIRMSIKKSSDFDVLIKSLKHDLGGVVIINIEWDGAEECLIPDDFFSKLSSLKYVYIRSYKIMSKDIVQKHFRNIIEKLKNYKEVVILYQTMEQPS
ncbi:hypothetical protein [Myroides sp. N17-2]|uniref:hypothetical protein n=1 Tax=Myroides sp. N17-2 TaxID=2030799 RepID=UPI00156E2482|nr:hypothetical protein [Myroides sp. N17-2]